MCSRDRLRRGHTGLSCLGRCCACSLHSVPATFWACREVGVGCGCRATRVCAPAPRCLLQEAADLSSLKPKLDELGVPLYAVVKEQIGTEVKDFQPYFKGEVFLDEKVHVLGACCGWWGLCLGVGSSVAHGRSGLGPEARGWPPFRLP